MRTSLVRLALCAACAMSTACSNDDAETVADPPSEALTRGSRYCELLTVYSEAGVFVAHVWGTQGLNDCPADAWNALDAEALASELGAILVKKNGPRYWLVDRTTSASLPEASEPRMFGDLAMHELATVEVNPTMPMGPYTEIAVNRSTTYRFASGAELYELFAPDGAIYVMQAYSQIVDPDLAESELAELGSRLALPDDWTYAARILDDELVMEVSGQAVVVQDELENTYQRRVEGQTAP